MTETLDANLAAAVAAIDAEATKETAVAAPAKDYAGIVTAWFNASVANSPVSRSVEAANHMTQVAVPALVAALTKG